MDNHFTKEDAKEFKQDIKRYVGILSEDFQHKLNIVIDGQAALKDGQKAMEERLNAKIDSLKDELIAHRDNTEMHVQKAKRTKKSSA